MQHFETYEVITKTKHHVQIDAQKTVKNLQLVLEKVPENAILTEITKNPLTLVFVEETVAHPSDKD